MHLYSLFSEILFLAPVVFALYRLTIGVFLTLDALEQYKKKHWQNSLLAALEIIAVIGLMFGAYAQGAAILSAVICVAQLSLPRLRLMPTSTVVLLLIMSIGQVFLGAGLFAFDLPL